MLVLNILNDSDAVMKPSIVDNVVNMEFDVLSNMSFLMSGKANLIGCVCV